MKNTKQKYALLFLFLTFWVSTNIYATSVNASTFGWNATNATTAFVNAIKSANDTVIIDLQVSDWMIGPTHFEYLNNKTIVFEEGVNLVAIPGAFSGIYSSLFYLDECNNITVIGYGANFKMQKNEYIAYNNSEFRHCVSLMSCNNINLYGLKLMDSGGDGILIASWTGVAYQRYCENIFLKDLWCDNHYRQGISICSVQHLRVENCWFTNTIGTAPQAGVDIEPNQPFERLIDIVFDKCRFTGNTGGGIKVIPISIDSTTLPMDITFNNCYVANNGVNKYQIETYSYPSGAKGNVRYNNCMTDGGTYSVGGSKLVNGHKAIFNNCVFRNPTDIVITLDDYTTSASGIRNGGISFTNCLAFYNNTKRFFNVWHANTTWAGLDDVQFNNFTVINPNNVTYNNGGNITANCVFDFHQFTSPPPTTVSFALGNSLIECNTTNSLLNFSRDASCNTTFPIAMTYSSTGTGIQGVDYSRMKGFEIIPFGSLAQADTLFVLADTVTEPVKQNTVDLDVSSLYSTTSSPQNVTISDCSIPTAPSPADNATVVSVDTDLSWILESNITTYDVYFGADPLNLALVVSNATAIAGVNSYNIPGLLADSVMHYWKVVTKNGAQSQPSPIWKFKTEVVIDQFPYTEGFEDSAVFHTYPVNSAWIVSPDITWYEYNANAHSGSLCAKSSFNITGNLAVLRSPKVLLPAGYSISYFWRNTSVNKVSGQDTTFLDVSANGGANWTTIDTLSPPSQNAAYVLSTRNLNSYAGNDFYFRFRHVTNNSGSACNVYLDDISIFQTGAAIAVTPSNQNVTSPAGTASFSVTSNSSWTAVSDQSWCSVTSTGSGNSTISAAYVENTGTSPRIANITISVIGLSPVIVTVTQEGSDPFLLATPLSQEVSYSAGTTEFTINTNVPWTATSNVNWCQPTASGSGSGLIEVSYGENQTLVTRIAIITVNAAGIAPLILQLIQLPSFVSVDDPATDGLRVFPNPVNDIINLVLPGIKPGTVVAIFDSEGSKILEQTISESKSKLNLSGLGKGSYLLLVNEGNKSYYKKIVIVF